MASEVNIGTIFGIKVSLHWTLVLLILLTLLISLYVFMLMVLLFACVLLHELAHSITSQRNKIKVKRIVLSPIAGASIIDMLSVSPEKEFRISIVGPIMSLFLSGVFGMLAAISPPGLVVQTFQILFLMNILLGVFNLLPTFPMDGGRIFRSYFQRKHNFFDSTMMVVKASKYTMALIVVGTIAFIAFWPSYSLPYKEFVAMLNFIAVMFLYSGTKAEEESAIIKRDTRGLHVGSFVTRKFTFVRSAAALGEIFKAIKASGEHVVITKIGSNYYYVDIFRKAKVASSKYARDLAMPIPKVSASIGVADALSAMESGDIGIAAVTSGGKLVGITTSALLQAAISLHMARELSKRGA
ncbi:MAG: site-2 protease family protein [Candidatus Micrarchaeaceae archaeon]